MKSRPLGSADDLDDDWWMKSASSSKGKKKAKQDVDADGSGLEEHAATETASPKSAKKRKHISDDKDDASLSTAVGSRAKRSKGSDGVGGSKQDGEKAKGDSGAKPVISTSPIVTQAEVTQEIHTHLSSCGRASVDEDDLEFPGHQAIVGTVSPDQSLTFSRYLETAIPDWSSQLSKLTKTKHGRPVLLVVTSSAIRSVELIRAASAFSQGCPVAKLFAKHFKLEQHQDYLKKTPVHMGVGTPNRILKLVESDHLCLKRLKYVVLDWTLVDAKQRQIFQIPEIVEDLVTLVLSVLMPRIKAGKTSIGLF